MQVAAHGRSGSSISRMVITSAVVVLIVLGFPIALVIAWAFEMTPEGMKRTENVSPNDVIPQWSARNSRP